MEAIERQTILKARPPMVSDSFRHLCTTAIAVNPRSINYELAADYSDEQTYSWCEGTEIVSGWPSYVPYHVGRLQMVWTLHTPPPCFVRSNANGVASGNSRGEAICHALCELVERDSWTFVELGAHLMPRARRSYAIGPHAKDGPDDLEMFPCVDLGAHELLLKFWGAGSSPSSATSPPNSVSRPSSPQCAMRASPGFPWRIAASGAHPNAQVAVRQRCSRSRSRAA